MKYSKLSIIALLVSCLPYVAFAVDSTSNIYCLQPSLCYWFVNTSIGTVPFIAVVLGIISLVFTLGNKELKGNVFGTLAILLSILPLIILFGASNLGDF